MPVLPVLVVMRHTLLGTDSPVKLKNQAFLCDVLKLPKTAY